MYQLKTFLKRLLAVVLIVSMLPLDRFKIQEQESVYASVAEMPSAEDVFDEFPEEYEVVTGAGIEAVGPGNVELPLTEEELPEEKEGESDPAESVPEEEEEVDSVETAPEEENATEPEELKLSNQVDEQAYVWLYWSALEEENVTYEIYRNDVLLEAVSGDTGADMAYCDTRTEAGVIYEYRIEGKNATGEVLAITNEVEAQMPEMLVVTDGYTLKNDMTVFGVELTGGKLDLGSRTLTVCRDFAASGGSVNIEKYGELICNGNVKASNCYFYSFSSSWWFVKGDILFDECTGNVWQGANLKGNLIVKGGSICADSLILSGEEKQIVKANHNTIISKIELNNYSEEGVCFESAFWNDTFIVNGCKYTYTGVGEYGYTLKKDMVIEGDYCLGAGCLDLNGHSLTIRGDFFHVGGQLKIYDGQLIIEGNYRLEQDINNTEYYGTYYSINTRGKTASVCVYGDVTLRDGYCNLDSSSPLEIGGDLEIDGSRTDSGCYFILFGEHKQIVSYEKSIGSVYIDIENYSEEGVHFEKIVSDIDVNENGCKVVYAVQEGVLGWELSSDEVWEGDLVLIGGILNLNGYTLSVSGDVIHAAGTVYTNGGNLQVEGNYRAQLLLQESGADKPVACPSIGRLRMESENDKLTVSGDFISQSKYLIEKTARGFLELKGNLLVLNASNSAELGELTLIFSGEKEQRVQTYNHEAQLYGIINRSRGKVIIESTPSVFGRIVDETGTIDPESVINISNTTQFVNGKWSGGIKLRSYSSNVTICDSMEVKGALEVESGAKLIIGSCALKAKCITNYGTIELQKGSVITDDFFRLRGELVMSHPEDYVLVGGNFEMATGKGNLMEEGIVEIKGDLSKFYVTSGYDYYGEMSIGNTVVFSGDGIQKNQTFSRLTICNVINRNTGALALGIENREIRVTGTCIDETGTVSETSKISLTSTAQIIGGKWNGSVAFVEEYVLEEDLEINGNIEIRDGATLHLNGNSISADCVYIEKGCLEVENGKLSCEMLNIEAPGLLSMQDASGYVLVEGNFITKSSANHAGYLTDGTLEIKGDFKQNGNNSFVASDNHCVVLSKEITENNASGVQQVSFQYPGDNRFHRVVFKNAKKHYRINSDLEKIAVEIIIEQESFPLNSIEVGEITETSVELSYDVTQEGNVLEYVIYRNGENVGVTTEKRFVDSGLEPDTVYVYEVFPRNDWGMLADTTIPVEVTTKPDVEKPVLQGGLNIDRRTGSSVTLSWNPAKDNVGVTSYTLYRDGEVLAKELTETSYCDMTLEKNRAYRYSLVAYDGAGNVSDESKQAETSLGVPEITKLLPAPGQNIRTDVLKLSVRFRYYQGGEENRVKIEYLDGLGQWQLLTPQLLQPKKYDNSTWYAEYSWDITHVVGVKSYALRYTLYDGDGNTDVEEITYFVDRELPKAPENLNAVADNGTIRLSWEPSVSEDCTEYKIYRKAGGESEVILIGKVNGQLNTSYTDKTVTAGVEYTYMLIAVDKYSFESEYSEAVSVQADEDKSAPYIEAMLPGAGRFNRTIRISAEAKDNKEAASVEFYYRAEDSEEWILLSRADLINGKAEASLDTSMLEDGTYIVAAVAIDGAGNESEEKFTRRYQVDNTGIAKIKLADSKATATEIQIRWEDVTEADFSYFQVEWLKGQDYVKIATVSDVLGYNVKDLVPDTTYKFRVVGYDNLGNRGVESDVIEVTTEPDSVKPTIVSVYPIASYYKDSLQLQVTARDNYALKKAVFYYSLDGKEYTEAATATTGGSKERTFTHTLSLTPFPEGRIYIKFEVYDGAGNKNALLENGNDVIVEYVIDRTAPVQVEGLSASETQGCVGLQWNPATDRDIKAYRIYRADGATGSFRVLKSECNTKNYYDASVSAGGTYRYKVAAIDIAGNEGKCSEEISVTVTADTQAPTISGVTPGDGETVGKEVTIKAVAIDNASLARVNAKYRKNGENEWTTIADLPASGKGYQASIVWNTGTVGEGDYTLCITATDKAGNVSEEYSVNYRVDHTAPQVPELTAKTGHFTIELTLDGEKSSDFAYYEIYRRGVGSGSYTQISTCTENSFTDTAAVPGEIYFYRVAVYDKYGNSARTEEVECYADDVDVEAPVARLPENPVGLAGMEIAFDGMGCSDNVRITQYLWDMGDGTKLEGPQPVHTYEKAGTYTVTLLVKDAAGNTAQATTTVTIQEKTGRGSSLVKVVDENGTAIPYASIFVSTPVTEGYALKADSRGFVTIVAERGTYNVAAYASGYLPEDMDISVSEYETREYTLSLVKDELIVGELTVHRMELEEMIEAGVDFSNPENYNRFVFNVTLTFAQSPIPVEIRYISGSGGTSYNFTYQGGEQQGGTVERERTVYIQEITQPEEEEEVPILAYVSTSQHVSWLKDMYEVELGILNAADSRYTIEDSVATLNLPESGVSLAKLVGGQSLTTQMGTIHGQERKTVSWVIKGDKSGRYALSADFEGILMPFQKKVTARFETESDFEVTTGEGIHIYVMPEKSAYIGEQYYIQFKIVNESEKPFYHFGTSIGAYEEPQKEYTIINEDTGEVQTTTSAPIAITKGSNLRQSIILEDGQKVVLSALLPGEEFYGTYRTTFVGEGDPETVYYNLVSSLVDILEGANLGVKVSVVPIESHIYRTRFRTEILPSYYGDPVDITSGYFTDELEAFAVKGATAIGLDMHYSSGLAGYRGELGYGWYHDYEMYLKEENGILWYYGSPGAKVSFLNKNALQNNLYATKKDGAIWPAEGEEYSFGEYCSLSKAMEGYRIVKNNDGTYTMILPNGIRYEFDREGRLAKLTEAEGKSVSISYTEGRMTITDDLSGKRVHYHYNSLGFLTSVTDDNGRECVLTYDARGCLTSYTDPIGNTLTYVYDEQHRILEAANANGTFVANVYDEEDRVTDQTDARGGKIEFSYEDTGAGMLVTIVDAAGTEKQATIDENGKILYVVNENGGTTTYVYDEDGNLLGETDAYGTTTSREYDEKGNIIKITDSDNRTTVMTYDANGNLATVIDGDGNTASYTYDERNLVLSATDYNGRTTTYEYDADGFLIKETVEGLGSVCYTYKNGMQSSVTDYKGNTSYMEYDGMGNLIKSTDAEGNVTRYEFNAAGQMERSIDNQGNVTSYVYDCNYRLTAVTDSAGNTTGYEYDAAGYQTAINYPDGTKTSYIYDSMGRCIEVCYADGTKESMEYDESGNLTKKTLPDGSTLSYKYDLLNRCVEEQDADGNRVLYEYYPNGKLYKISYPDGSSLLYTYNKAGQTIAVTDHTGATISYEYDVKGNVIAEWDALGHVKRYVYDVFGRLTDETDANGNTTTYEYDANSNCIKKTNALGVSVHMKYDKRNRLTELYTETKNGVVYKVSYEYDSLGRVTAVTDEEGNTSRMTYDALGNVTSVTDALGRVQSVTTYDGMGRTATVRDALGITTEYSYDAVGNLLAVTELLNGQADRVTGYEYDSLGRLTGVTDPLDGVTAEVYNKVGEIVSRTDANGGTTSYTYDCMGRLLTELNPIGSKTSYTYNVQGLLAELTNARGQKTAYTYDAAGRVTSLTDELGTMSYEYDANGNVLKVTDESGSILRKYDELNRVTEYTDYNGNTVKYAYDEIGNLIALTYPGGEIVRYTYYKNGWLETVTDSEGRVTSYEYDANGNLTHTTRANGTEEFCTYNEAGLLVEQKDVKGEEVLNHYTYTYDARGNIATVEGTETTAGDLTRLVSATMTYDAANRLLTYNGETLRYDADGNMTYGPVDGKMTELIYDCRNRLVSAGGVTYTYDAENNRIAAETDSYREVYVTESVSSSLSRILSTTRYEKKAGKVAPEGETTLYIYGNGLIYEYTDDAVLYHHYNNLGSTTKLTDEEGTVVASYTYGVYGELLGGDTSLTRFLYNGRCGVSTDDNGLYYMRQRYYNPTIKRFVNRDILTGSIGNSQSLNRYSYVQGNPVSYTDPFGLSPLNGLFSGTMLAHGLCELLEWIPGPVGGVANAIDGLIYWLVDKDYKNAVYSLGSAVSFGAGKLVEWAGKGSKTARRIQRVCYAVGSGINFAQSAEGTYQMGGMMIDKYIIQGQSIDGSILGETFLLVASGYGTAKSGRNLGSDVADLGRWVKSRRAAKKASGAPSLLQNNAGFVNGKEIRAALAGKSGSKSVKTGEFFIDDWTGYPDAPKPDGPFRILEGTEYTDARNLANKTNANIHRNRPDLKGIQIHEMHPVKFGGSPTDIDNKIALSPKEHAKYTAFWNKVLREQKGK